MAQNRSPLPINPGKGLGFLLLGGSLRDVLVRLKTQPSVFPVINVEYAPDQPLFAPINLSLPQNGLRLRFDGPDQRLRLIEVLDFSKIPLTYKGTELVKIQENEDQTELPSVSGPNGPTFRHVYSKLFGPTFAGEYYPSSSSRDNGTYILSYPGVAFSFVVQRWPRDADFVSVLSSPATSPAKCLSIFSGSSWEDARQDLLTRPCPHPRSLALAGRGKESCPDEIEFVIIKGSGQLEMRRRNSPNFNLKLGETTQQDLVASLGPPDAVYRKNDRRLSIHKERTFSHSDNNPLNSESPGQFGAVSDTDRSSISTATDYSSPDDDALTEGNDSLAVECFYNYFNHGFDVFVSYPLTLSPPLNPAAKVPSRIKRGDDDGQSKDPVEQPLPGNQLVATKILLHGNVPGSHAFNRHRRSRWVLDASQIQSPNQALDSETPFFDVRDALKDVWQNSAIDDDGKAVTQRHMVLNRGWGDSPGSSIELLGGWEESADSVRIEGASKAALGNTDLYGFPGLLFEVLKNDAISCLTVY
ncbi:hypothetical protein MMC10_006881 [Thelotrema lepadinum]|nr:hypothetical protein [Thelotrema lepadinum]